MPRFIVRVVLHKAKDPDDYKGLHEEMEKNGYYRTIEGSDGSLYELPSATYSASKKGMDRESVRNQVCGIAKNTGFKYAVIATSSNGSAWRGLDLAD